MTIRDVRTIVSDAQSLVGQTSVVSTSSIKIVDNLPASGPLTGSGRDIGAGEPLAFRVFITQAFDGGVGSVAFDVISTTDAALTAGLVVLGTVVVPAVGLVLGNEIDVRIPSLTEAVAVGGQFLGLRYRPNVAPATGAVSAWIPFGDGANRPRRLRVNYTGPVG